MGRRARATRREVSFDEHSKQVPAAPPRGLALGATPPAPAAIGRLPSPSPTAPHPHPLPTPARAALGAEQHGIVNLESLPYYANIQYSIVITNTVTRTLMSASSPPTHNTPSSHPLARRSGGVGACDPLTHSAGAVPDGSCSIATCSSGSSQLSSTVARTLRTYSFMFSLYNCAASAFAGLLGFGSCNSDWIDVRIAATSYVGDHRFWRMSKHSSPLAYTLGWNIRDKNLTVGGLLGYDSSNVSRSLNVPSSNGVSANAIQQPSVNPPGTRLLAES